MLGKWEQKHSIRRLRCVPGRLEPDSLARAKDCLQRTAKDRSWHVDWVHVRDGLEVRLRASLGVFKQTSAFVTSVTHYLGSILQNWNSCPLLPWVLAFTQEYISEEWQEEIYAGVSIQCPCLLQILIPPPWGLSRISELLHSLSKIGLILLSILNIITILHKFLKIT